MRIPLLIIASRSDIAGGETYLLSCLKRLDTRRYEPIVWLPGEGPFAHALRELDVEYLAESADYKWLTPPQRWYPFLADLPRRVHRLVQLIRDRRVSLVHTNSNMILEGALAASIVGVHHLYLAHIEYQPDLPIYQRLPLDRASFAQLMNALSTEVLAVSNSVRDALSPPIPESKVRVVHNGLELARYDDALDANRMQLRRRLGIRADATVVVAAGRVMPDKGFDVLVDALPEARRGCQRELTVLICGSFESEEYLRMLKDRIATLGLSKMVRFLGRRNDLPELFAASDVFVLPSRREGHPYVLLEAMACNLPCVASRCGGVEETVTDGETGFIVPIEDSDALAARLETLLTDAELRQRMGQAAGRRVRERFTAEQTARGLFECYEDLVSRPAPTPGAYPIDLFLRGAAEIGYLGQHLTCLEERSKKMERAAELLLDNPLARALRWVKAKVGPQ